MAKRSGGRFAVLGDQTFEESLGEEKKVDEVTNSGEKARKKKKKKKKQKEGESSVAPPTEDNVVQTAKTPSEILPLSDLDDIDACLKVTRKEKQQTSGNIDSFRETAEQPAETSSKQPNQKSEVTTIPRVKRKKKKKKSANSGTFLSEVNFMLPKAIKPKQEVKDAHSCHNVNTLSPFTDLEMFSKETTLLSKEEKESQNLLQVLKLMYGLGLNSLRKLFMDIHRTWSNKPADALNLDKGGMNLKGHESALFKGGDINKWDVSLITTVLLHSKKCKDEISKRPGFEEAIRSIKDHKNLLISHNNSERISDADFQTFWPSISKSIETIGGKTKDIEDISKGNILENGKVYRDLFLEEMAAQSAAVVEIRQVRQMVEKLVKQTSGASKSQDPLSPRHGGPNWNEWIKFCDNVLNFDHFQNNYILLTDAMPAELMESFSILRSIPWKTVLDFDPSSEVMGMYQEFTSNDAISSLINMITPAEIRRIPLANLSRQIDANKTQWMFVNGREHDGSDGGPQELEDWEDVSVKEISTFFRCYSEPDKLDKNKPVVCLILPFREETVPFINVTIRRLVENFNEFKLNFVGITPKGLPCALPEKLLKKINLCTTALDPQMLHQGMKNIFHISSEQSYHMPTSQAKLPVKLTQKEYLYLKEYLEVLYEGCEDSSNILDNKEDVEKNEDLIAEHRKSFLSGNWISFLSLFYNHDAKREISNDIRTHIQRLLDQGITHSSIVEICHSPGSGGSTIARRVMWDLHKSYPCVFAKLEDHKLDLEDDTLFLDRLVDRISALQEICHTTPVVLLDGKHTRIEALSNRLARILRSRGKRAVLIRCNYHSLEASKACNSTLESSDVHGTFSVNVKLEQSKADLKEFESKYKDHIKECKQITSISVLSRVFHFPLFAMLEEFRNKLQEIISESFDEMTSIEKEMVIIVAFIQRYAAQAIPAPLLYAIFKQQVQAHQNNSVRHDVEGVTYEDISTIMTERLSNLMVPAYPGEKTFWCRGFKRPNYFQQMYTLQHPVVAEMVLQKGNTVLKRDTLAIAWDFLGFPIYEDIRFVPLMKDLFVLNGCGQGRFSVLFEELKAMNPIEAGEVFCEAAEKTKDIAVVTSAARFFAKLQSPSFPKAKELIEKAFECRNAKEKHKTIYDVKGVVLSNELKFLAKCEKITSLSHLETLAQEVLKSFKNARTFPPSFPNPLIGEVKTWITCLEWITKNVCNGDSKEAVQYISSPEAPLLFRNCISGSFHLLDVVDYIVQSVRSLPNPEKTQREANNVRLSLLHTFKTGSRMSTGRNKSDIIQECKAICSAKMFPSSSQMELKRLQVQYVFSSVKKIENIDKKGLAYLLDLLKDLVEVEKEAMFANHLMRISILITGPKQYDLDQGLKICAIWNQKKSSYDAQPNFYEMIICFLKILDGEILEYRAKYQAALEGCREKSYHNCRRTMSTHFLGKTGTGMSRFMTRNTLFRDKFLTDEVAEHYWKTKSRKKLVECCGRLSKGMYSSGKKTHLVIKLLQGNIELFVSKSAAIGEADRDFVPDSKVFFVVSFNLLGPVANGITFKPSLSRQQSNSDS